MYRVVCVCVCVFVSGIEERVLACFAGNMYNIIKKDGAIHGLDPPSTFAAVAMMAKMMFEGPGTRQLQLQRLHH